MKVSISTERGEKLSESQVREKIQQAAKYTRERLEKGGERHSQESIEKAMIKNAEKDVKDGKL